jgi:GMP synthase (glutamine-hydrolysing)
LRGVTTTARLAADQATSRRPRILVIEHEDDDPPAHFGAWLEDAGCEIVMSRPWAGDRLPHSLGGYNALLVLGGWMSAHHDEEIDWLAGVRELFRQAARDGVPALGICLGHQLAAVALGGEVGRNPRGLQLGLIEVGWAAAAGADPLFGDLATPRRCTQWNYDVVTGLPKGAVELARASSGELQAARFASTVWGIQGHPEVDEPLVRRWARDDADALSATGTDTEAMLTAIGSARTELDEAWQPLAHRFAAIARGAP